MAGDAKPVNVEEEIFKDLRADEVDDEVCEYSI